MLRVGVDAALLFVQRAKRQGHRGMLLSLDVGTSKCGVAVTDPSLTFAVPLGTIERRHPVRSAASINVFARQLRALATKYGACGCVCGWPVELDGSRGAQCNLVHTFVAGVAQSLASPLPSKTTPAFKPATHFQRPQIIDGSGFELPFALVDERFSTVEALQPMYESGTRRARMERLRDGASAVVILHRVLDDPRARSFSRLR